MKASLKDRLTFWGWDMLSLFGGKPYTSIAWKLFVLLLIVSFHYFFILIATTVVSLWYSRKCETAKRKRILYVFATLPWIFHVFSNAGMSFTLLVAMFVVCFFSLTLVGRLFNRFAVPRIVAALTGLSEYEAAQVSKSARSDDKE